MSPRRTRNQSLAVVLVVFFSLFIVRVLFSVDPLVGLIAPLASVGKMISFSNAAESDSPVDSEKAEELLIENSRLRKVADLPSKKKFMTIRADILTKNVQSYRQLVRLNRGLSDGVKIGSAVLDRGRLIGEVTEVSKTASLAVMLGDPDFRAAATIADTGAQGIISVESGGLVIGTVNRIDVDIKGQTILTSGLGGVFPPNLYLGKVGVELSESDDVFARYAVVSSVDYSGVQFVEIITRNE